MLMPLISVQNTVTPLLKIFQNPTFLQEHSNVCALPYQQWGRGIFE